MNIKYLFKFAFIVLISFVLIGCESKSDLKNISISMNTWPGYEPIFLAKEKNYLGDNVRINRVDSAIDVVATFHSGITDIAFVTLDEVLILLDRVDYGIKIIAIMDTSNGGDVILSQKNIKHLRDLKGKKVGVESTAVGAYMLLRAFNLDPEIDLSDIQIVPMLYSEHEEAFKNHHVSAVVTFGSVKTALVKRGANIMFDSSQIPGEIVDVMIVKDKTIEFKEEEVKKVLNGWFKAVEYLKKNHNKAISIMAKYEGVTSSEFSIAHDGIIVPTLEENREYLSSHNNEFADTINRLQNFLIESNMKHKKNSAKDIFTDALLPK